MHSLGRRQALALLGSGATAVLLGRAAATTAAPDATLACVAATPQVTEGPYWVDEKLFRSDIRTDPATGVARPGVPLALTINVQNSSGSGCVPLAGAYVDIWHCDAIGIYSDEPAYNPGGGTGTVVTSGQRFLRGYQITDDKGQVQFLTIYPGWYSGRTIHIHVRVRTYSGNTTLSNDVTQIFFDEATNNVVMAQAPYSGRTTPRDTTNSNDNVYAGAQNPSRMLATLTQSGLGYAAAITLGVTMQTAAASAPAISSGGVAEAAGGSAGVTPGSWTSIYGSGLASATRTLSASDVVNNTLPTTLGGVGVKIDGKDAYPYFVSSTQINVLAPADSNLGSVLVTVTNSAGTSSAVAATMQSVLPGLFTASNYVRAVGPSDGVIVNGTGAAEGGAAVTAAAKAADILELYGTGFGPATGAPDAGQVFTGAYPTTNAVTVTIGGQPAAVSFAGLVGPGLYQINVAVPTGLAAGDNPIVATVAGLKSQATALLKIAS
jgi:uncharacterized protein (TIGR03437 family)